MSGTAVVNVYFVRNWLAAFLEMESMPVSCTSFRITVTQDFVMSYFPEKIESPLLTTMP